jgi:hypothetical protein
MRHIPAYNGAGRLHWVTCSCRWQSGAFHRSTDADRAFARHSAHQVSASGDPTLIDYLRSVAMQ